MSYKRDATKGQRKKKIARKKHTAKFKKKKQYISSFPEKGMVEGGTV